MKQFSEIASTLESLLSIEDKSASISVSQLSQSDDIDTIRTVLDILTIQMFRKQVGVWSAHLHKSESRISFYRTQTVAEYIESLPNKSLVKERKPNSIYIDPINLEVILSKWDLFLTELYEDIEAHNCKGHGSQHREALESWLDYAYDRGQIDSLTRAKEWIEDLSLLKIIDSLIESAQ